MLTSGWCTTLFKWWICAERKKAVTELESKARSWFLSVPFILRTNLFYKENNSAWIMSHNPVQSWPTRFRHNTSLVRFRKRLTLGFKQDANYSLYPSIKVLGSMGINGSICRCYKGNKMKVVSLLRSRNFACGLNSKGRKPMSRRWALICLLIHWLQGHLETQQACTPVDINTAQKLLRKRAQDGGHCIKEFNSFLQDWSV